MRNLTEAEIQDIVSYTTDYPAFVQYYTKQLQTLVIDPGIIPKLKVCLKEKHDGSLVKPGTNVGIICAQSIGEKFTQSTLNTFHKAGLLISGAKKGIPRAQELLEVSKSPEHIFYTVCLGNNAYSFEDVCLKTKDLEAITLKHLAKTIRIVTVPPVTISSDDFSWRHAFHALFGDGLDDEGEDALQIQLDRSVLFEHE